MALIITLILIQINYEMSTKFTFGQLNMDVSFQFNILCLISDNVHE